MKGRWASAEATVLQLNLAFDDRFHGAGEIVSSHDAAREAISGVAEAMERFESGAALAIAQHPIALNNRFRRNPAFTLDAAQEAVLEDKRVLAIADI